MILDKAAILSLYPEFHTVIGPYTRKKDKRKIVLFYGPEKSRTTRALAKVLLEVKLGRRLVDDETADHIDGNPSNDDPDNLQVLPFVENIRKSAIKGEKSNCLNCWAEIWIVPSRKTKSGRNFCSNSCRGKFYGNQYARRI